MEQDVPDLKSHEAGSTGYLLKIDAVNSAAFLVNFANVIGQFARHRCSEEG